MATWKTVSDIARDLPGAELDTGTAGNAAWRVNGKVIVRRNPRLDGPAVGEVIAIRTSLDERGALLEEDPSTFFVTDHWAKSRNTSVLVRLATVDDEQLRELITEAWRVRANKSPGRQVHELTASEEAPIDAGSRSRTTCVRCGGSALSTPPRCGQQRDS